MALSKIHFIRKSMMIISIIYFVSLYILARIPMSYDSIYEEVSDTVQLHGPLFLMTLLSPQAYLLLMLSLLMHVLRKNERVIKEAMWLWSVLFVVGSAWTALFIYAIENS